MVAQSSGSTNNSVVKKTDISVWGRKLRTPYRKKDPRQAKKKASRKHEKKRRRRRRSTREGGRALRELIEKVHQQFYGGGVVAESDSEHDGEVEEGEVDSGEGSGMASKKEKQNGLPFQEEQEARSGSFRKKGGQAEVPPPLAVPKPLPRAKGGGSVKSPMNQDRSPWK